MSLSLNAVFIMSHLHCTRRLLCSSVRVPRSLRALTGGLASFSIGLHALLPTLLSDLEPGQMVRIAATHQFVNGLFCSLVAAHFVAMNVERWMLTTTCLATQATLMFLWWMRPATDVFASTPQLHPMGQYELDVLSASCRMCNSLLHFVSLGVIYSATKSRAVLMALSTCTLVMISVAVVTYTCLDLCENQWSALVCMNLSFASIIVSRAATLQAIIRQCTASQVFHVLGSASLGVSIKLWLPAFIFVVAMIVSHREIPPNGLVMVNKWPLRELMAAVQTDQGFGFAGASIGAWIAAIGGASHIVGMLPMVLGKRKLESGESRRQCHAGTITNVTNEVRSYVRVVTRLLIQQGALKGMTSLYDVPAEYLQSHPRQKNSSNTKMKSDFVPSVKVSVCNADCNRRIFSCCCRLPSNL